MPVFNAFNDLVVKSLGFLLEIFFMVLFEKLSVLPA
jgi:hypothetical protein